MERTEPERKTQVCSKCHQEKSWDDFQNDKTTKSGKRYRCRECCNKAYLSWYYRNKERVREIQRKSNAKRQQAGKFKNWRELHPEKALVVGAKSRAKEKGLPFNIDESDVVIPATCPVLGIELKRVGGVVSDSSPTVDRIIPELGYVKGNILVISNLANKIKSTATPEQILRVGKFYEGLQEMWNQQAA